ncbi:hypothetical protein THAOC_05261, partial [Thalassiosira oceanica]
WGVIDQRRLTIFPSSRLNTPADSSIDPTNGASDRSLDDSTKDIAPGGEGEDDETEVDRRRLLQIHKASVRLDDLYR